jgi:hypothetical protein
MSRLEFHQTLHGYSDGHRLLAASRKLPREAERTLLVVSDISGPVTAGAFESYLTGCPLPGAGAYALARTWLATELGRPGCVWTQTLLIADADLARMPDLRVLRALFRRPRKGEPRQAYGQPAPLPLPLDEPAPPPLGPERDLCRVLTALYGVADAPTFLVADRAETLEDLVLALWSQQWPRLRGALRFCTWALAPRAVDGHPFDLQVVPPTVSRQLKRGQGAVVAMAVRWRDEADPLPTPAWASAAARDLLAAPGGELRQLLWSFGADTPRLRPGFAPLAEIAAQAALVRQGALPVAELIESVATHFPRPRDGQRLKAALFGEPVVGEHSPLATTGEEGVLRALATTRHHPALDGESLALGRRAAALWRVDHDAALELAVHLNGAGHLTPLGDQVLRGLAGAVQPAEGAGLRAQHPRLFAVLVERNPSLVPPPQPPTPPVEEAPPPRPAAAAPPVALERPPAVDPGLPPEPPAPPAIGPEPAARQLAAEPPAPPAVGPGTAPGGREGAEPPAHPVEPGTVGEILDWVDRAPEAGESGPLPARWRATLEARPAEVVDWVARAETPRPATLATVAAALDPHAPEVRRAGPHLWLRATADAESLLDKAAFVRLMAFLLALGFDATGPGAEDLVARAFDAVDKASASGDLPPAAWESLAPHLPTLPWWRDWDRCERLRRGLVERVLRHRWPPELLLRVTRDDETFQRLIVIAEWTRDGQALLRRLAARVWQGRVEATGSQRAALAPYA